MLNQNPREIRGEVYAYQDMKSVARAGERFANTERSEVSITFTVFVHRQLGSACCRMMEGGNELRTPFTHFYWDPRVTSEHDRSSATDLPIVLQIGVSLTSLAAVIFFCFPHIYCVAKWDVAQEMDRK